MAASGPASCCVFYGWVIVALCIAIRVVSMSAASMTPMTFLQPALTSDESNEGLTPTRLSMIYAAANWAAATTGPALGHLLDRSGSRWCLFGAMLGLGGGMLSLSLCHSWQAFLAAFLCVRTVFRSALEVWCVIPISLWFEQRRGRAMAAFSLGETILSNMCAATATAPGCSLPLKCCAGVG